ncbi:MAG: alpha/beta hydrolase [Bacteroidota bacterium]
MLKWLLRLGLVFVLLLLVAITCYYQDDKSGKELWDRYALAESKTIEVDGLSVHYRIVGEGSPILLLHGTAASLHTWSGWVAELQENYQLITLDLPAFGLTGPHPEADYSIASYVAFVESFRKEIGLDSFVLGGNSLGGLIAWNYAAQYPQQVNDLILIDPSGFPTGKEPPLGFRLAQSDLWSKVIRYLTPKSLVKKSLLEVYGQDELVSDALVDRYFDMLLREGNRQAFIDRARTSMTADTSLLTQIDIPTLLIWGAKDEWIPVELAYRFSDLLPQDTLVVFDELGHVPMEENPKKTLEAVKLFLD